jgi:uncharacterized protein
LREQLKALRELQEEDRKIHEVQKARDAIPAKIDEMRGHLDAIYAILEKERTQLSEAERFRREQEREMKAQAESLQVAKSKTVRNTKEYTALQREMESQKKSQEEREEEIIKLLSVIEESSKSIAAHEAEYKKLLEEVTSQEKAGREKMAEFDKKLEGFHSRRKELSAKVPKNILARYDQILKRRKDGIAVVEARGGSCSGCHMHLPPQLFNTIIKSQSVELCPSCHRILFFERPEDAAAAQK